MGVGNKQILQTSEGPSTLIAFLSLLARYSGLKNAFLFKMQQHATPGLLAVYFSFYNNCQNSHALIG